MVRALSRLTKIENPSVFFLMETRLKASKVQRIWLKCDFTHGLEVDCSGEGKDIA